MARRSWLGLIVVIVLVAHAVGIGLLMVGLARKAPNADPQASEVVLIRMVKAIPAPAPAPAMSPPLSAAPARPLVPPLKTRAATAVPTEAGPVQPQKAPQSGPALMAPAARPLASASAAATVASAALAEPIPEPEFSPTGQTRGQPAATVPALVASGAGGPSPVPSPRSPAPPGQGVTDTIAVICPTQVQPKVPRRAVLENISGVVRARALIRGGVVQEVTIVSGPSVYHGAVRAAMLQYRCVSSGEAQAVAEQVFTFRIE